MELRHLPYFTAVAAHGSFNRTSQILHPAQPVLSRQVRNLEDEIGAPLVVRGTNSVKLTALCEAFYEDAREVLTRTDQVLELARGTQRQSVGRVGRLPATAYGIMVDALATFHSTVPNACRPDRAPARENEGRSRAG